MSEIPLKNVKDIPLGTVIKEPGSSLHYKTGGWRNMRPLLDREKCVNCLLCWIYCPEGCIRVKEGKIEDIDLEYCKGCAICMEECPPRIRAISMVEEIKE